MVVAAWPRMTPLHLGEVGGSKQHGIICLLEPERQALVFTEQAGKIQVLMVTSEAAVQDRLEAPLSYDCGKRVVPEPGGNPCLSLQPSK